MSNLKHVHRVVWDIKAPKNCRNRPKGLPLRATLPKSVNFPLFGAAFPPHAPTGEKFSVAKQTHVSLGQAKFHANRCNESPLWGENADFWLECNGSLPLCGILPVTKQWNNTINQENNKPLCGFVEMIPSPWLGFLRGVFLANHLASTDNLARTTKR